MTKTSWIFFFLLLFLFFALRWIPFTSVVENPERALATDDAPVYYFLASQWAQGHIPTATRFPPLYPFLSGLMLPAQGPVCKKIRHAFSRKRWVGTLARKGGGTGGKILTQSYQPQVLQCSNPKTSPSLALAIFFNLGLEMVTLLFIFFFLRRYWGMVPAFIGFTLYGLAPNSILHCNTFLPENVLIVCLLFSFYFFYRSLRRKGSSERSLPPPLPSRSKKGKPRWRRLSLLYQQLWENRSTRFLCLSAVFFGFAALTKPIVLFLPLGLLPFLILSKVSWGRIFLFLGLYGIFVGMGVTYNVLRDHAYAFTTLMNNNAIYYEVPAILLEREQTRTGFSYLGHYPNYDPYRRQFAGQIGKEHGTKARLNDWGSFERYAAPEARKMILKNFPLFLYIHLKGFLYLLQPRLDPMLFNHLFEKGSPRYGTYKNILKGLTLCDALTLGLFLVSIVSLLTQGGRGAVPPSTTPYRSVLLLLAYVLYLGFLPGPVAMLRFRVPLQPFLCLGAALGASWVIARFFPSVFPRRK